MFFDNVTIEAVAYELGPHRITSASLEGQIAGTMERLGISPGHLENLTGIRERRFWDPGVQPSEAATLAARKLIDESGIDPNEIGCLVNTSVSKDFIEPSVASLVHGNLKLSPLCLNFDIGNACVGFLNGMQTVGMMIDSGAIKYGLVVCAEGSRDGVEATIRRLQSPTTTPDEYRLNFASLTIGSGAVAMLLTHKKYSRTDHTVNGFVNMAATEHNRLCTATPTEMITYAAELMHAGFTLGGRTWKLASETLKNWSDETIDRYIPHQVSVRQIKGMAQVLRVTPEKIQLNVARLGNMGAAALPITLAMAEQENKIKSGHHVGLLGIGSGLNCSIMSVSW